MSAKLTAIIDGAVLRSASWLRTTSVTFRVCQLTACLDTVNELRRVSADRVSWYTLAAMSTSGQRGDLRRRLCLL